MFKLESLIHKAQLVWQTRWWLQSLSAPVWVLACGRCLCFCVRRRSILVCVCLCIFVRDLPGHRAVGLSSASEEDGVIFRSQERRCVWRCSVFSVLSLSPPFTTHLHPFFTLLLTLSLTLLAWVTSHDTHTETPSTSCSDLPLPMQGEVCV